MAYNKEWYKEYYERNKRRKYETNKAWKAKNADKVAQQRRREVCTRMRRVFGITFDDYERMSEAQDHKCKICQRPEKGKRLAVDHCHTTRKVRGLLCAKCNQGIGHFDDDPDLMLRAIEYVQRNISPEQDSCAD